MFFILWLPDFHLCREMLNVMIILKNSRIVFCAFWKREMNIDAVFKQNRSKTFEPPKFNRRLFEQFLPDVRTFFWVLSNTYNRNCSNVRQKLFERTKVNNCNKLYVLIISTLQNLKFGRIFVRRGVWWIPRDSQETSCKFYFTLLLLHTVNGSSFQCEDKLHSASCHGCGADSAAVKHHGILHNCQS